MIYGEEGIHCYRMHLEAVSSSQENGGIFTDGSGTILEGNDLSWSKIFRLIALSLRS